MFTPNLEPKNYQKEKNYKFQCEKNLWKYFEKILETSN